MFCFCIFSVQVIQHKLTDISVIDDYDDFVKNFNQFSLEGLVIDLDSVNSVFR